MQLEFQCLHLKFCFLSFSLFLVTLDYKTLVLLLVKKEDKEFVLGGRGVDVEFCFLCNAIRVYILLSTLCPHASKKRSVFCILNNILYRHLAYTHY